MSRLITAALLLACLPHPRTLFADEPPSFQSTVQVRTAETLRAVADYVAAHPEADDADEARGWLFETAIGRGLETVALPTARATLRLTPLDPALRTQALQVACVGAARAGDLVAAQEFYSSYLRGFRLQSPFKALDVVTILSARAQLAGDRDAIRGVYESFETAFALNGQASEIVQNRLARLERLGKPLPDLQANDLEGRAVSNADFAGKVLLVDFWATNCAPCLAEFPNLRRLHRRHQPAGFEILGVTFDDSPQTVAEFTSRNQIAWRQILNPSGTGGVAARFQTRTIPALFLIDRQGQVAFVDVRGAELREAVEQLIQQPAR